MVEGLNPDSERGELLSLSKIASFARAVGNLAIKPVAWLAGSLLKEYEDRSSGYGKPVQPVERPNEGSQSSNSDSEE